MSPSWRISNYPPIPLQPLPRPFRCTSSEARQPCPPGTPHLARFRDVGISFNRVLDYCRHKLSYNEAMPMTSLNISLPEALKDYVEGQVASGDWGTPSEYVRDLIREDKERRMGNLEQELIAAAKGPKIELHVAE